jgi:hypothetical protein
VAVRGEGSEEPRVKITRCTSSWRFFESLIHLYRSLTTVKIGDDKDICFWLRHLVGLQTPGNIIPGSLVYVQNPNTSAADCHTDSGWTLRFRHITSHRAEVELCLLLERLDRVVP